MRLLFNNLFGSLNSSASLYSHFLFNTAIVAMFSRLIQALMALCWSQFPHPHSSWKFHHLL